MSSLISTYDGSWAGPNTVGSTPHGWILGDALAVSPYLTSDVMVYNLEISVGDPNAVLHIRVGRMELDQNYGGSDGVYHRDSINVDTLPSLVGPISDPPSYFIHQTIGAYFLSGGHPLQIQYREEEVEAMKRADGSHDHAFVVWIQRVDSDDAVPYHINARFEVNR